MSGEGGGSRKINNIWGNLSKQGGVGERANVDAMDVDRRRPPPPRSSDKNVAARSWQAQLEDEGMQEVMNSMSKNSMVRTGLQPRAVENYLSRRVGPAKTRFAMKRKHDDDSGSSGSWNGKLTGFPSSVYNPESGKKNMEDALAGIETIRKTARARRSLGNNESVQEKAKMEFQKSNVGQVDGNSVSDRESTHETKLSTDGNQMSSVEFGERKEFVYVSDSDISDGDLSDESGQYLKRQFVRRKLGSRRQYERHQAKLTEAADGKNPDEEEATPSKRPKVASVEPVGSEDISTAASLNVSQTTERTRKREEFSKLSDEELMKVMLQRLRESKKFLIENALKVFGRSVCVEKFLKALKIEYYGGLLQKNGINKRTKGGVFMYLIKNDALISEDLKAAFNLVNEESECVYRSKRQELLQKVGKAEVIGAEGMKSAVIARVNKSVVASKPGWNLEGKEFCAPTMAGRLDDNRPRREIVDYSEIEFPGDSFLNDNTLF